MAVFVRPGAPDSRGPDKHKPFLSAAEKKIIIAIFLDKINPVNPVKTSTSWSSYLQLTTKRGNAHMEENNYATAKNVCAGRTTCGQKKTSEVNKRVPLQVNKRAIQRLESRGATPTPFEITESGEFVRSAVGR